MSPLPLDPATLDAMVLHTEDSVADWEALVRSAAGLPAWQTAVQQREQIDHMAERLRKSPWLATVLLPLRRAARALRSPPDFVLQVWEGPALLAETLGATVPRSVEPVTLSWGQVISVRVPVGRSICLQPSNIGEPFAVFALSKGIEHALPHCEWTLERNEAPVLLIGCMTDRPATTLFETLPCSRSFAGILLEEAA